jgi:hypothetical protein
MPATAPSNETFAQAVAHFNAEAYRDALLAFEQCWFSERNDFLRGLLQLSNALNQLRLGLITGPRRTLASAARLLAPYEPQHTGLDMAAVCAYIAELRACIPADLESNQGRIEWLAYRACVCNIAHHTPYISK